MERKWGHQLLGNFAESSFGFLTEIQFPEMNG